MRLSDGHLVRIPEGAVKRRRPSGRRALLYYENDNFDLKKDFSRLIECIKARDSKLNNFLNSTFPTISQITRDEKLTSLFRDKKHARPDLVFKIEWPEGKEKRFHESCSTTCGSGDYNSKSKLAFHGSKPENFYSILQHGLVNCLNKRDLFGSGTYLSTEIDVALSFAPAQVVNIKERLSNRAYHIFSSRKSSGKVTFIHDIEVEKV